MKAKRTDANQKQIVADLRKAGIQVHLTSGLGDDFPDILCGTSDKGWVLVEVKAKSGSLDRGQLRFLSEAKGHVGVVTDSESAINLVRYPSLHALDRAEQERIAVWLIRNEQESLSVNKFFKIINGD